MRQIFHVTNLIYIIHNNKISLLTLIIKKGYIDHNHLVTGKGQDYKFNTDNIQKCLNPYTRRD